MNKMHVKRGDKVVVIAGKDKGKEGNVVAAFPEQNKVIVEGVAVAKKHQKARSQTAPSGIVEREGSIDASNVMIIDPKTKKPTRVSYSYETTKDGKTKKVRISKASNYKLD